MTDKLLLTPEERATLAKAQLAIEIIRLLEKRQDRSGWSSNILHHAFFQATALDIAHLLEAHLFKATGHYGEKLYNQTMEAKKSGWDDAEKFYSSKIEEDEWERREKIFKEIEKAFPEFAHTTKINTGYQSDINEWNEYTDKWQALRRQK